LNKPKVKNMKNLNKTIEKATMPNLIPVTSVNRTFLYSLCAAFLLLTGLLSMKALTGDGSGHDRNNAYELPDLQLGVNENDWETHYTSDSPFENLDGTPGNDKWLRVHILSSSYLTISTGSQSDNDFDPVLYLYAEDGETLLDMNDDSGLGPYTASAQINTFVSSGYYYIKIDGTNKNGHVASAGLGLGITIN
jgi:hypothetical protein